MRNAVRANFILIAAGAAQFLIVLQVPGNRQIRNVGKNNFGYEKINRQRKEVNYGQKHVDV